MKRRTFLKNASGIATGIAIGSLSGSEKTFAEQGDMVKGLPRRVLGRTGEKISVVGFPGLALSHYDQERCNEGLLSAYKKGVNYYDVAPAYGRDGDCEKKMGIGLKAVNIDRKSIFLACKTKMRDKEGARFELERSLERLKTDYFDLYQMHHLRTPEEVEKALGPGGAIETFLEAKKEGKVRYLGFSAHTTKSALAVMKGFRFDTAMFPINFVEYFKIGFGKPVLELAEKQGVGVLAIKPLSKGGWPEGVERKRRWWYRTTETQYETDLVMRFTLSQKNVAAGIPPSFLDLLDLAIESGRTYRPIREDEMAKLQVTATDCLSIFHSQEQAVAKGENSPGTIYPDNPQEYCPCAYA
ncbi:MAG: aldo/keto reductase [Sedimentisphaerales bacterium]|nr:aldo/keto reductase [Sedimentisphaerales bacterium]